MKWKLDLCTGEYICDQSESDSAFSDIYNVIFMLRVNDGHVCALYNTRR